MTDYTLALDPRLGLSPADFAALWNADPAAREVGTVTLERAAPKGFDAGLATIVLQIAGSVALGVVSNIVYDLLKQAAARARERGAPVPANPPELIDVQEISRPDGTRLLIVTVRE
jgi:hypothetical protein